MRSLLQDKFNTLQIKGLSISNSLAPGDSHSIAIGGDSLEKRAKALKPGTIAIGWHAIATGKVQLH